MVSFVLQKLFKFNEDPFFIVFISVALTSGSWMIFLWFMSEFFSLTMFFSDNFIVSSLTYKTIIHLSLFWCIVIGCILISFFFLHVAVQFSQQNILKRQSFLYCVFLPLSYIESEKVKLLSHVQLFVAPWTVACQAPPSMRFSRQEY